MPVIGTAGHIDHGKTSLVKALTGQDTDRTGEEKVRGISIHLGFAYLELADGTGVGVVDVPGHERFIRNMLAGSHGIDAALFAVAADDGVMPQTEEHFDILHLLGIEQAVFVITKADLATPKRLEEVEQEIRVLARGSSLESAPVVSFSLPDHKGLHQIRREIAAALDRCQKFRSGRYFRLPVDRAFSMPGIGLIVTGTALGGSVKPQDRVRCLPVGELFRVRSVQVHDRFVETASAGERVALNLTGPEAKPIARGDVICQEEITMTSTRFDAFLEVRPKGGIGVRNHQRLKLHLGTAERMATLILLGECERLVPKQSGYCQIALSTPVLAIRGDRFIIRDETAQRTLGGGVVLHPCARRHKRAEADVSRKLKLLHLGERADLAEFFIDESEDFAVSAMLLRQFLDCPHQDLTGELRERNTIRGLSVEGETVYTVERKWVAIREQLVLILRVFHTAHPFAAGMNMEEIRGKLCFRIIPKVFRALIDTLEAAGIVIRDRNLLRLVEHRVRLGEHEATIAREIKAALTASPLAPPGLKEIESKVGIAGTRLMEIIHILEREGTIVRVSPTLCFLREAVERVKEDLQKRLPAGGEITPTMFRDFFGTSRKYSIPILEYLDREGTTVRIGGTRKIRTRPG